MIRIVSALLLLAASSACIKDDASYRMPDTPMRNDAHSLSESLIAANGLVIKEFIEDGSNLTQRFSPYRFVFDSNGTVTATGSGETLKGAYSVFTDDGKTELRMEFRGVPLFDELNDDWYLREKSGDRIRLADGGDILIFERR